MVWYDIGTTWTGIKNECLELGTIPFTCVWCERNQLQSFENGLNTLSFLPWDYILVCLDVFSMEKVGVIKILVLCNISSRNSSYFILTSNTKPYSIEERCVGMTSFSLLKYAKKYNTYIKWSKHITSLSKDVKVWPAYRFWKIIKFQTRVWTHEYNATCWIITSIEHVLDYFEIAIKNTSFQVWVDL